MTPLHIVHRLTRFQTAPYRLAPTSLFPRPSHFRWTTTSSSLLPTTALQSIRSALFSSSAKENELRKFQNVEWWDPYGECAELHRMNPLRCRFVRNVASARFGDNRSSLFPLRNLSVLDVGCGGGILSEALGRLGGTVTAIDLLQRNIDIAQKHVYTDPSLSARITYRCVSTEALVQEGQKFDLVVASEVIEHVDKPDAFVQTLSALMKPCGVLCVTTLNRTFPSLVGAIWIAEYVLRMIPTGTHDWRAFLTPAELTIVAKRSGLELDQLTGMWLNPLSQQWSFSRDTSINYAISFTKSATDAAV